MTSSLELVWHTLPEKYVVGTWPEWAHGMWIPLMGGVVCVRPRRLRASTWRSRRPGVHNPVRPRRRLRPSQPRRPHVRGVPLQHRRRRLGRTRGAPRRYLCRDWGEPELVRVSADEQKRSKEAHAHGYGRGAFSVLRGAAGGECICARGVHQVWHRVF